MNYELICRYIFRVTSISEAGLQRSLEHLLINDFKDDGEHEAVRQHLQQQVVRRHLNHPLPQQEGTG